MTSVTGRHRWLVLPIENYVREFYGKLLLSAVAAERGWATIMGYKGYLRHNLPQTTGVLIEINMTNEERVSKHRSHGYHVSAWDEEGLIYLDANEYCRRRVDAGAVKQLDHVFLWGENQRRDILSCLPGTESKLILSGNPRADLLRPDLRDFYAADARDLREQYGQYILINTNFGYVNHYFGKDYIFNTLANQGRIASEAQASDQRAREGHQALIMQAFVDMLPNLTGRFPKYRIIIRPHPSEDFETWRAAAQGLPNVSMIHHGDAMPWLLGAEVVIHNSCTTGVQAYLLQKPVISYMPVASDKYDQFLPNALSVRATDLDQLLDRMAQATQGTSLLSAADEQERRGIARKYIAALDGPWAAERIMDEIDKLDVEARDVNPDFQSPPRSGSPKAGSARSWAGTALKALRGAAAKNKKTWEAYQKQRFPTLTFEEMSNDLARLQEVAGRFAAVRLAQTGDGLIWVMPAP